MPVNINSLKKLNIERAVNSGPPVFGTYVIDDEIVDSIGQIWVCWLSGTPGEWIKKEDLIYTGPTSSISISSLGSDITIGDFEVNLRVSSDYAELIKHFRITGNTFTIPSKTTRYIVCKYNGGSPLIESLSGDDEINESDIVPVAYVMYDGNDVHWRSFENYALGVANRHNEHLTRTRKIIKANGFNVSEDIGRVIVIDAGQAWYGILEYNMSLVRSDVNTFYQYFHVGGVWNDDHSSTMYNNLYYDDGVNRVELTDGKYAVNWIFRLISDDSVGEIFTVYGNGDYDLIQAQLSKIPEVPEVISSHCLLLGRIIVLKGAATATVIDNLIDVSFGSISIITHNDLGGKQGGVAGEYYHLTSTEHETLTDGAHDADALHLHESKADKVGGAVVNNFAGLDVSGDLIDSGHKHSDYAASVHTHTEKADKVIGAVNNNFAALNASGNLKDSGKKNSDFVHIVGDEDIYSHKSMVNAFSLKKVRIELINGDNKNVDLRDASFVEIVGPTSDFAVSGFEKGYDGRILFIYHNINVVMALQHLTGSEDCNQVNCLGVDQKTDGPGSFILIYDEDTRKWILFSSHL